VDWRHLLGRFLILAGSRIAGVEEPPYERGEREGSTAEADGRFLEMCAPPGEPVIVAAHSDTSPDKVRHIFGSSSLLSDQKQQVRQLIKAALETPTPQGLAEFLDFSSRFRRLAVWNARMVYIQRPGAQAVASEYEWHSVGRTVLPDAVPIIILWPFSPIRFVYELADTAPPIDRDNIGDPFAAKGEFNTGAFARLEKGLKAQKTFRIEIEPRRQGFDYAGSAVAQGHLPGTNSGVISVADGKGIGKFAMDNATSEGDAAMKGIPVFRVTINDRLNATERFATIAHELGHIFCGHLGASASSSGADDESGWPDRRGWDKNEKEIEAEAVAYLIASRAGVVTASAAYLQNYAREADMGKVDVELIVRAAARVERLAKIHYGSMVFKAPSKA